MFEQHLTRRERDNYRCWVHAGLGGEVFFSTRRMSKCHTWRRQSRRVEKAKSTRGVFNISEQRQRLP